MGVIVCFIMKILKLREVELKLREVDLTQDHTAGREQVFRLRAISLVLCCIKGLAITADQRGVTAERGEELN